MPVYFTLTTLDRRHMHEASQLIDSTVRRLVDCERIEPGDRFVTRMRDLFRAVHMRAYAAGDQPLFVLLDQHLRTLEQALRLVNLGRQPDPADIAAVVRMLNWALAATPIEA